MIGRQLAWGALPRCEGPYLVDAPSLWQNGTVARRASSTLRKVSPKGQAAVAPIEIQKARVAKVTARDVQDAREGDRYRRSGRKGITIDEADEILRSR